VLKRRNATPSRREEAPALSPLEIPRRRSSLWEYLREMVDAKGGDIKYAGLIETNEGGGGREAPSEKRGGDYRCSLLIVSRKSPLRRNISQSAERERARTRPPCVGAVWRLTPVSSALLGTFARGKIRAGRVEISHRNQRRI